MPRSSFIAVVEFLLSADFAAEMLGDAEALDLFRPSHSWRRRTTSRVSPSTAARSLSICGMLVSVHRHTVSPHGELGRCEAGEPRGERGEQAGLFRLGGLGIFDEERPIGQALHVLDGGAKSLFPPLKGAAVEPGILSGERLDGLADLGWLAEGFVGTQQRNGGGGRFTEFRGGVASGKERPLYIEHAAGAL